MSIEELALLEGVSLEELDAGAKTVRDTWVEQAKLLPDAKASWLVPWEKLDDEFQKNADRAIWLVATRPYRVGA